jgi:hypothetical protein
MMRWFHRGRKRGQITPFLIAVIAILLIAIMVTVNLGKISMTKTHTANAADAGALAGASTHTNTLNAIADRNSMMIANYLANQIAFLIPITMCMWGWRYAQYLAFIAMQATMFATAWDDGSTGYREARNFARQLAFSNAAIDEAKPRNPGESYEAWLQRKSRFEQWMDDKRYERNDNDPVTYSWEDGRGGQNSVTVTTDAPDFPGLIPMPGVLQGTFRDVIGPCGWGCLPCIPQVEAYEVCYAAALIPPVFSIGIAPFCCSCVISTFLVYPVPIAFIADIRDDDPEITVTVNRIEPEAGLGLWRMRYESQGSPPGTGITSSSTAKSSGGRVGPVPDPDYDSYLISAD